MSAIVTPDACAFTQKFPSIHRTLPSRDYGRCPAPATASPAGLRDGIHAEFGWTCEGVIATRLAALSPKARLTRSNAPVD